MNIHARIDAPKASKGDRKQNIPTPAKAVRELTFASVLPARWQREEEATQRSRERGSNDPHDTPRRQAAESWFDGAITRADARLRKEISHAVIAGPEDAIAIVDYLLTDEKQTRCYIGNVESLKTMLGALRGYLSARVEPAPIQSQDEEQSDDDRLAVLWGRYCDELRGYDGIQLRYAAAREKYDAEMPECPDDVLPGHHARAFEHLRSKHGLDKACDEINAAHRRIEEVLEAIRANKANSLFGLGVKLAALSPPVMFTCSLADVAEGDGLDYLDEEDPTRAHASALRDLIRLTGREDLDLHPFRRGVEVTSEQAEAA